MSRTPPLLAPARRRDFGLVAVLALGQAAAAGLAAVAVRNVFAGWQDGEATPDGALLLLAAGLLTALCRRGERVVGERLGLSWASDLRRLMFRHVARMPAGAVAQRRAGGLALRFVGDLAAFRGWAARGATRLVSAAIALPGAALALAWVSPAAALGAAPGVALGLGAMALAGAPLGRLHRSLRTRRSQLAGVMTERLGRAPELRLAGRMPRELSRLDRLTARLEQASLAVARRAALLGAAPDLAGALAAAGAMLACSRAGVSNAELAGALAAIAILTTQMRDLSGVWSRWRSYAAAEARLATLLAASKLPKGGAPARVVAPQPALRFVAVTAGPLRDLTLRVRYGETVALTGPSGAGKSMVLRLAAGLEAPASGKVTLDRKPLGRLSPATLARHILHLPERPLILSGSLRRALGFGAPDRRTDAELLAAAERVGLGPLVARLGGLGGRVAESGRNLSAGESARIGLARLALAPTALALLDAPEAHLDEGGRATLLELIRAREGATLIATHDRTVAEAADRRITLAAA